MSKQLEKSTILTPKVPRVPQPNEMAAVDCVDWFIELRDGSRHTKTGSKMFTSDAMESEPLSLPSFGHIPLSGLPPVGAVV